MKKADYGARVERGIILLVTEHGHVVASLDRNGITTPPIQSVDGTAYSVGDIVYFFLFNDGSGKILCAN